MMMAPRLSGQGRPVGQGMTLAKNTNIATPMQISGTTIGRAMAPSSTVLPLNLNRQSTSAAMAPRITLIRVEMAAMVRELPKAAIRLSFWSTFS